MPLRETVLSQQQQTSLQRARQQPAPSTTTADYILLISYPTKDTGERLIAIWSLSLGGYVEKWLLSEQDTKRYLFQHLAPSPRFPQLRDSARDHCLHYLDKAKVSYQAYAVFEQEPDLIIAIQTVDGKLLLYNQLLQRIGNVQCDAFGTTTNKVCTIAPWKNALLVATSPADTSIGGGVHSMAL